jgi:predicted membrane-bound mannosyltransferase
MQTQGETPLTQSFQTRISPFRFSPTSALAWLLPIALVLVSLAIRFYLLGNQGLWGDEGDTWYVSKDSLMTCLERIRGEGSQPPLSFVLQWFWNGIFGTSEVGLRSLAAVAGALGILPVWAIATKLGTRRLAIVATLLAAVSPLWVYYSQEARPYALSLTFTAGAIACAQRMVKNKQISWAWLIGYVLCAGATVMTHYFAAFALLSIVLMLERNRKAYIVWIGASIIAAIPTILWLQWVWGAFWSTVGSGGPKGLEWSTYLWGLGEAFVKGLPSPTSLPTEVMFVGLALALIGALKRESIPLLVWLALVVIGAQVLGFPSDRPGPWVRYMISALPALILLEAIGIERLWEVHAAPGIIASLAMLGISIVGLWHVYFDPTLARFDFRTPATELKASIQPDDRVIINHGNPAFSYYFENTKPDPISIEAQKSTPVSETQTKLAQATANAHTVYLIKYMPPDYDPGDTIEKWLNSHGIKTADNWVEHIRILSYDFDSAPGLNDPNTQKISANFGETIQMVGWSFVSGVKGSDQARVTLFWQAKGKTTADYKAFVHLMRIDDITHVVTQHDSIPALGGLPTSQWEAETTVTDSHPLTVPSGDWMLEIGLYDPVTGQRPVVRMNGQPDDSRVLVGPIHVP